jgi:alpha-mannosidase
VLEDGPLRVRVAATTVAGGRTFRKEYVLVAGEPFLRMTSTGSAALGTSVMVHFPLAGPIDDLVHGTAYHWDEKRPERAGPFTFEATHDFLVPQFGGLARAAIFHAGVPAWAARRDGLLIGALWRNANQNRCDFQGADGTDPHDVAVSYAIRVPTGVSSPRSGAQLREALAFETPLLALVAHPTGHLPRRLSLASATPKSAILTAAKAGTADDAALILRIYQPTNAPLHVVVRTAAERRFPPHRRLAVEATTALEVPVRGRRIAVFDGQAHPRRIRVFARRALTTIAIRGDDAR